MDAHTMRQPAPGWGRRLAALALALGLAACGGGKDAGSGTASGQAAPEPTSQTEAARFLAQASFGADDASIAEVSQRGYRLWLAGQFAKPQRLHRDYMDRMAADLALVNSSVGPSQFYESFWQQAITGEDQLRQRAAFALSQIFVVSLVDGSVAEMPRGVAAYYDMLGERAFGSYRQLLEGVALHPMMGLYLSHLRNQKEDPVTGRVPDENFAREVMQLFSIGLYELNTDGTLRLDGAGRPIETYTNADVQGLAKVFTGWSWYAGTDPADRTRARFFGWTQHPERDWRPMQAYNRYASNTDFHSVSAKSFLGTTIAAQSTPDPDADLRIALDRLAGHPNVGPFFGRQLIQRLVTSNPSPAYVGRVAAVFNDNGSGARGDLRAVLSAVLLDPEARNADASSPSFGKLREPVLRLANFLRAYKARSTSGRFLGIDNTDDPASRLGQTAMRSPSVFNFYRPGYAPPNTSIGDAGLVAPELQLAHEVSVAGYLNYMRGWAGVNASRDVQQDYSAEISLAADADRLVERANLLLMGGQMPAALRAQIVTGVNGRAIPAPVTSNGTVTNQAQIDAARRDRASLAAYLTLAAPDYLVQR